MGKMLHCSTDKEYFRQDFKDPGLPETGIGADLLADSLRDFLADKSFATPRQEHVAAFNWLLEQIRIGASPDDLFITLGFWGRKPIEQVISIARYQRLEKDQCAGTLTLKNDFICSGFGCFFMDYAHNVPDWQQLLSLGFPGLLARAEAAEKAFYAAHGEQVSADEKEFFDAVKSEYTHVLALLDRIITTAENAHCQPATIRALRSLRTSAPGNFYEAMLMIWLYYQLSEYGDCVQTRSFGNLDVMLIDYYRRDLASGTFTEEDIRTIVRNFYSKVSAMKYYWGHPFYMGGTQKDGSSAFNELSVLLLEEYGKMGIYDPKIQIKVAENTPEHILDLALNLIRRGTNSMVFVGEPCLRSTMLRHGYTEEEARTAVVKGCYEYCPAGTAVETAPCILSMPSALMYCLRKHAACSTFEELFERCVADIKTILDQGMAVADDFEQYLDWVNPVPLFSGTSETALARGIEGYGRGAKYNNSNVWFTGPATAADSLAMVKKYVFDRKEITLPEFLDILDRNWAGAEKLQRRIAHDRDRFGNNSPYDNAVAVPFLEQLADHVNFRKNSRGGFYTTALHSASYFIFFGRDSGATPDGRRAGEEFTKNISPAQGGSICGVTAMISSVLKLDPTKFMADFPVDVMLHPSAIEGAEGLAAMRELLMTYIRKGGHAMHFNIFSADMLEEAQKDPEKYRDLQVRVCGWNVLWNDLDPVRQEQYLKQARANENLC